MTDEEHQRFVNAKMQRKEKSLQSLMIRATEQMLRPAADSAVPYAAAQKLAHDSSERVIENGSIGGGTLIPTEGEVPWIEKALKVLRSKKPGLPGALKSNLVQFEDAADAWDERETGALPASQIGSESPGPGRKHTPAPRIIGSGSGIDAMLAGVDQTMDKVAAAQRDSGKTPNRTSRKTG